MNKITTALLGLQLLTHACDGAETSPAAAEPDAALAPASSPPGVIARAPADPSPRAAHDPKPRPVLPGARAAFSELAELVDDQYVDGPLSEDELWTAAMEGVMARLIQLPEHEVNKLLPPREHEALIIGTEGRLVGVGIMIEHVADVVVVRGVIPGGPADKAGLQGGDRILGVDGERLRDLSLPAVVDKIRGAEGSTVDLFVQRDTEEWTETVTRGLVQVASVEATIMREGVGLVRITSFSQTTVAELDAQLESLAAQGATRLVLDLRYCPGGLLEASLEVASRFVPPDTPILTIEHRGGEDEVRRSAGTYPSQAWPLAVLIGPWTASGAEILVDAIAHTDRGPLIGEATLGKHTIEAIHELREGWAVKLSVSRFATASGENRQGAGVQPNIPIPSPKEAKMLPLSDIDLTADPALATALEVL